jgi:hypothetical protein
MAHATHRPETGPDVSLRLRREITRPLFSGHVRNAVFLVGRHPRDAVFFCGFFFGAERTGKEDGDGERARQGC